MIVCAHGEVADFCKKHNMMILDTYDGELIEYRGGCPVIVTSEYMARETYDSLKCELFSRGVDMVSVHWADDEFILRLIRHDLERRNKRGGRQIFGFYKANGTLHEIPSKIAVAQKIIDLRDAGMFLREIQMDEGVRHMNGRKISMSTIQTIIENREKYGR